LEGEGVFKSIPIQIITATPKAINIQSQYKDPASTSLLGKVIACSYVKQAITPIIDVIAKNIAADPNSSGGKYRVITGADTNATI
jgi:hypothetical protein